jgi:TRAP transporter TAXI family solute receptor
MGIQRESRGRRQRSLKDFAVIGGPSLLLLAAGFAVAYLFVEPAPPGRIEIATGGRGGAYFSFAERYRDIVAAEGVELVLRETSGSIQNLSLLGDPTSGVQIAFVQGGTGDPAASPNLMSIASLYYEPIWLFHRRVNSFGRLSDLSGKMVGIGAEGSGTQAVAQMLLHENGVTDGTKHLPIEGRAAADALQQGLVDAVFIVASPKADFVRTLLTDNDIQAMNFGRADAYSRRHRFLSEVSLPQGVIDLARNIPRSDVTLVASTAALVARNDLHPALVGLLLHAAEKVHRSGGLLEEAGQFPSGIHVDFPLSDDARRFLKSGPSFLQRYLPFWVANFLDRTKVMMLPLLTLLYPLFRMLPPVYRWRMRSKVTHCYRDLSRLEEELRDLTPGENISALTAELARIEGEVRDLHVPPGYLDRVYALRLHIDLVRAEVARSVGEESPQDADTKLG